MLEETEVATILFERKVLKKMDNSTIFIYLPLQVIAGTEYNFNGTKILESPKKCVNVLKGSTPVNDKDSCQDDNTYEFSYIDDISNMNEKYVYGFSIILDGLTPDKKLDVIRLMREDLEEIREHNIFHTYREVSGWSKLFVTANDLNVNINAENYYELQDLMYGQLDDFKDDMQELINEQKPRISVPCVNLFINPHTLFSNDIYEQVRQTVISQDDAIKKIAIAVAKNSRLEAPYLKSNLLICGPTGVGKTEIFRSIRDHFKVPVAFEDSNEYTAASFKGKDVTEMLAHLYENADGDIEKAQRGILIVDEIDKKAGNEHETMTSAVINSLLKMMEGHTYKVEYQKSEIEFDTSLLTFAFLGAFSGIEELSTKKRNLGFLTSEQKDDQVKVDNIYTEDTLKKYGLLPEFLGRCDTVVRMNDLNEEDLIKIMKNSNKSQLRLYKQQFYDMGIDFVYGDDLIEAIAKKAVELKRGARSIKKIVEEALADINYQIYSSNYYHELIISPEILEDNKKYILR